MALTWTARIASKMSVSFTKCPAGEKIWNLFLVIILFFFQIFNFSSRCRHFYTARRRRKNSGVFFCVKNVPIIHISTLPTVGEKY